ncbi:MAG: HNH endonuclease [Salinibacter sp.]
MSYSQQELQKIFQSTSGRCHLCHSPLQFGEYADEWEVDHSKAKANGGTDHGNNLYPACKSCNRARRDRPASKVREENGVTGIPLSRKQREKEKKQNGLAYGSLGALAGGLLAGGPAGLAIGAVVGGSFGFSRDPDQ